MLVHLFGRSAARMNDENFLVYAIHLDIFCRDIEEVRSSAAPSVAEEDAERTSSQGLNDRVEADSSLEGVSDETGLSENVTFQPRWEVSDREAPECK